MRRLSSVLLVAFLTVISMRVHAQTVDTAIGGVVSDSTGAVLPGATVIITNPATAQQKQAVTSAVGEFNINYLTPGHYDVRVSASGFATYEQKGLELQLNQSARITVSLATGSETQVIEVQTSVPLLQVDNGTLGAVIGPERAENLPLNGRKINDLATLTPGVVVSDPNNHTSSTAGSTVVANGAQNTWGQVFVDGITMVNNRSPYINLYPSVDAIQEFTVLTGNYGAQYGGGAGAIVNMQLKSGGNQFHGVVFEYIRNDAVDARNFFRPAPLPKVVLKQNQFGGVLTGPIIKNKTFFMASYEGLRSIQQTVTTTTVFTPAMINGDFSAFSAKIKNPYVPGTFYPNNQVPIDKNVQNVIKTYMPLPNQAGTITSTGPLNNYNGVQTGDETVNQYIGRIDHSFNQNNQFAIHYIYAGRNFPITGVAPAFSYTGTYNINNAGFQYVHTFNANLINEFRGGINFEHVKQLPLGFYNSSFTAAQIGINQFTLNGAPLPPSQAGFPTISVSGYLGFGSGTAASNLDYSRTYQINDNLTWVRGRHTLLFGGDVRQLSDNATTNNTPFGSQSFTGAQTGNAGADFLIGVPSSVITPEGVPLTAARQWRYGFYAQDNFKASSKLTLNFGLRYDLWLPPHNNLDTSRTLNFSTPTPTLVSLPNPLWHISHKDFSPRFTFAYSMPWQTVLRGGYGITFYGGKFDNINILQLNPPIDSSFSIANPVGGPATFEFPVPASIAPASANVASLPADDNHPDLYLQTYNLTLSKQFGNNVVDISYVGVKGTHQDTSIPYFNSGNPQYSCPTCNAQAIRPYPTYGRIRLVNFGGASQYNGLQTKYEHRISYGLSFTAAYAFAKLMDNQGGDTNGSRNETQIPAGKEWANGLTDVRSYLSIGMVWNIPTTKKGDRAFQAIVNGWIFTSLYSYATGTPLFVTQSTDGALNDNLYERPDYAPGKGVKNLGIPAGQRQLTPGAWFNNTAYTSVSSCTGTSAATPIAPVTNPNGVWAIACGHYGNVQRNPGTLRTPAQNPLTLGISRIFKMPFAESQSLMFRFEAFNALNEPQFASPGATFGSSSFGIVSSTSQDNRDLQLAAKYMF